MTWAAFKETVLIIGAMTAVWLLVSGLYRGDGGNEE